jgi:hypothetical protein
MTESRSTAIDWPVMKPASRDVRKCYDPGDVAAFARQVTVRARR